MICLKILQVINLVGGKNDPDPPLYVRLQKFVFGEKISKNRISLAIVLCMHSTLII